MRRRSAIAGWGVYALEPITKNTRIVHYGGERITHAESERREKRHLPSGHIWCFTLNRRWVLDGSVDGTIARFINHACKPNCYAQVIDNVIWIRAAKPIATGEELTFDYNTAGAAKIACRCRPGCTTVI